MERWELRTDLPRPLKPVTFPHRGDGGKASPGQGSWMPPLPSPPRHSSFPLPSFFERASVKEVGRGATVLTRIPSRRRTPLLWNKVFNKSLGLEGCTQGMWFANSSERAARGIWVCSEWEGEGKKEKPKKALSPPWAITCHLRQGTWWGWGGGEAGVRGDQQMGCGLERSMEE